MLKYFVLLMLVLPSFGNENDDTEQATLLQIHETKDKEMKEAGVEEEEEEVDDEEEEDENGALVGPKKSWKVRKGGDAFPGCNHGRGGKTVEECQAYAEANNFEGFGRVLRDGNCCFKSQTADALLGDLHNVNGVDFYYYGASSSPKKNWKVRNGADAYPGCNHGKGGKTVEECQVYAEANNFEGFGRVLRDGNCCFKSQNVDQLLGDLRDVGGVDFYYQKEEEKPKPEKPKPKPAKCSDDCFSKRKGKLRKNVCKKNKCKGCKGCR